MKFLSQLKDFFLSWHFLKHFGLIVLVHILVIGALIIYLSSATRHGQKVKVPSLLGKNIKSINALLMSDELGYEVLDSIYAPDLAVGTILSQDPRPTDSTQVYVKEGRVIRLRLSKKTRMVEMPNLVDKSERFAQSVLKNRGLSYSITYKPTSEANGAVMEQFYKNKTIKEGVRIPIGSTINLYVGRNEVGLPFQMPNLMGLTINEVRERLGSKSASLFPVYKECLTATDSSQARVISQSPEFIEGVLSPANCTISIQLGKAENKID